MSSPVYSATLDASALMAWLQDGPGASQVDLSIAAGSVIGAVNLSEVVTKLVDNGATDDEIDILIGRLAIEVVPFDADLAYQTGLLRRETRSLGLSLGDRACLALAKQRQLPALTSDRIWEQVQADIRVHVIR